VRDTGQVEELLDEAGLADPSTATHEQRPARAVVRARCDGLEKTPEVVELLATADEHLTSPPDNSH
jgi:hypothetical protein